MRKVYFLIIGIVLFSSPLSASAYCSAMDRYRESAYLSDIASNVMLTTFYDEENGAIDFSIKINNLYPNLRVKETTRDLTIYYDSDSTTPSEDKISGYDSDQVVSFELYPHNSQCLEEDELLMVRHVEIPGYNPYYGEPICQEMSSSRYCRRWYQVEVDYDEFVAKVEADQETDDDDDEEIDEKDDEEIISLFGLISEYRLHILGLFGIIVLVFAGKKLLKRDDFDL